MSVDTKMAALEKGELGYSLNCLSALMSTDTGGYKGDSVWFDRRSQLPFGFDVG